jgi:hypothetical protein
MSCTLFIRSVLYLVSAGRKALGTVLLSPEDKDNPTLLSHNDNKHQDSAQSLLGRLPSLVFALSELHQVNLDHVSDKIRNPSFFRSPRKGGKSIARVSRLTPTPKLHSVLAWLPFFVQDLHPFKSFIRPFSAMSLAMACPSLLPARKCKTFHVMHVTTRPASS